MRFDIRTSLEGERPDDKIEGPTEQNKLSINLTAAFCWLMNLYIIS